MSSMKIYNLSIMYNSETEEVEYIRETIDIVDEEYIQEPNEIEIPLSPDEDKAEELRLTLLELALHENGGIGFT